MARYDQDRDGAAPGNGKSEEIFRQIELALNAAKISIDVIDADYNIRYIDPYWKRAYGPPEGKKCYEYFMGRNAACATCGIPHALATRRRMVTEERLEKEGGRPIQVVTIPFQDEKGEWLVAEINIDISERKRMEEALRGSEQRFRTIAERANVGIVMGEKGKIVYVNKRFADMFGYGPDEMVGANPLTFIAPSDRSFITGMLQKRFMKEAAPEHYEVKGLKKSGEEFHVEVSSGSAVEISGVPTIISVVQDVTIRKEIEARLKQSEMRYRKLFEEGVDAMFVADPETRRIIDCNREAVRMTGYSRRELLSMRADQLHPKEVAAETMLAFGKISTGSLAAAETEVLAKDNRRVPVSIRGTLLEMDGRTCLMGIFRDVSERRTAENALQQSEELYRTLAELASDFIFVIDKDLRVKYVNSSAAAAFRKKPRALIGNRISELFGRRIFMRMKKNVIELFKTGRAVSTTAFFSFPTGDLWLDSSLCPITDPSGTVVSMLGISRDATARKMEEDALRKDRENFENLVNERSRELVKANEELSKAKRLSDIGLLAATIAHEIRNPLAAIRTAAYNIRRKAANPLLDTNLANIEKKIAEADQIIKNLLFYARIKIPQYEKVDIKELLDECVAFSRMVFKKHKVAVHRELHIPKRLRIDADPTQLKEVFINILNNAYESFPRQKGRVTIKAEADEKGYLTISIADSGPGIAPAELKRVTEPFFTTKARGTGLGIPVCRQLLDLHNGSFDIRSSCRKGTTVTVILPVKRGRPGPLIKQ